MKRNTILAVGASAVLAACLGFVIWSFMPRGGTAKQEAIPVPSYEPIHVSTPTPRPSPTPKPVPTPEATPVPAALPFALERGFLFTRPSEYSIPAQQAASLPEAVCKPIRALVSEPTITRSEPDEAGTVTWVIRYTTTADASFMMPAGMSCENFYLFAGGYDLFDYDTGRMLNSRAGDELLDEQYFFRDTYLPFGEDEILVSVEEQTVCSWDKWQFEENEGRQAVTNRVVVKAVLTVWAPAEYDGLILGLDLTNRVHIPDNLFTDDAIYQTEDPEFWEGEAEDWAFVRADEHCTPAEPEEETEEDEEEETEDETLDEDAADDSEEDLIEEDPDPVLPEE